MEREAEKSTVYAFDEFRLDAAKRRLYGPDGKPIPLKAKAFETLLFLVRNPRRVVERDELLAAIWPHTVVEENNLTQHISSLRRLFGEKPDDHRFIATVPGRGYMFVANVQAAQFEVDPVPTKRAEKPKSKKWFVVLATSVAASLLIAGFFYKNQPPTAIANGLIRSIAVLPFKPLTEQNRDESFELGMTNDLIAKLAGAEGLEVRPFSAVIRFGSPDQDAVEAGRRLGVEAVLDPRIQLSGDRVRVSVRLIRVVDSKQLWAPPPFEESLTSIFDVQDSISERVANALRVQLSENAKKRYTDNPEAYRLYLSGRFSQLRLTPADVNRAIDSYRKAIDLDPNYALAYTGISDSYRTLILSAETPPSKMAQPAIDAAVKAIEIDPELAEAHTARGTAYFWFEHDWLRAETEFKRSLELDPNSAFSALTHINYAHMLSNTGRHDEARVEAEKSRTLDPYSALWLATNGLVHEQAGQLE